MKRSDRLAVLRTAGALCALLLLARDAGSKTERPLLREVAPGQFSACHLNDA